MNHFEYGFFDELEKIAVIDLTQKQLIARYPKHAPVFSDEGDVGRMIASGKMSRRDRGDLVHLLHKIYRKNKYKPFAPVAGKDLSDLMDIAHRQATLDQRRQMGLPTYGLG